MGRRHYPRSEPPPVTSPRVPDVARDKGVRLSRAERRAQVERQLLLYSTEDFSRYSEKRQLPPVIR